MDLKNWNPWIIAILAFALMCDLVSCTYDAGAETYSFSTTVESIDRANDIVTVVDYNGNLWGFSGVEDWQVGDVCALTMSDNNTAEIYDDEILNARYCGGMARVSEA